MFMDKSIGFSAEGIRDAICELLLTRLGLHFSPERWTDLVRRIAAAAPELGYDSTEACLQGLIGAPPGRRELEVLASHLTVGETYFFRDPETFAALEQQVLPELIRRRRETMRRIRIWSVGCSSGEEPYSIAMTLAGLLPDLERWNISILATDVNPHALARARDGIYGNWSFRNPLPLFAQRHFIPQAGGRRVVSPRIKSLVSFGYLNLMDTSYPAIETNTNAMDMVFCRNVLMYFHPQGAQQVLERLAGCLLEGGWLVVSPVENSLVHSPLLTPCRLPELQLHQKVSPESGPWPMPEFPLSVPAATTPPVEWARFEPAPAANLETVTPLVPASSPLTAPSLPESAPSSPEILVRQARDLANRGLLTEALACCEGAIALDKLNPAWTFLRASVLLELGHREAASAALLRCLYLDNAFVMAHFVLANLLLGLGQRKEARRHYRNVLDLLTACDPEQVLTEADSITAGRLREVVEATLAAIPSNEVTA